MSALLESALDVLRRGPALDPAVKLDAAIAAAGDAEERLRASAGGGMSGMTREDRAVYEALCAVHSELRRLRAGIRLHPTLPCPTL